MKVLAGSLAAAALAIFLLRGDGLAAADREALPRVDRIAVGLGGAYKVGCWAPLWVTLVGGQAPVQARLDVSAIDGDGVETRFVADAEALVDVPAGATRTVLRYVKPGRVFGDLNISLWNESGLHVARVFRPKEWPEPLLSDRELVVTYGGSIGIEDAFPKSTTVGGPVTRSLSRPEDLPDNWLGYESVDVMVLTTHQPTLLDSIDNLRFAALRQWVRTGGRLILCVGARGNEVLAASSRLAEFVPGQMAGVVQLRSVSSIETFTGSPERLQVGIGRTNILTTLLRDVRGRVDLSESGPEGRRPLVIQRSFGFGHVLFVALDLDAPPFASWPGRSKLAARLLRTCQPEAELHVGERKTGAVSHVGYRDLAGQLRVALDQFRRVPLIAFSWIAGLAIIYIALLGPGDYFFLQRFVKRMQWTWITFPALILGFSGLAVWLNVRFRSADLCVNQVDVVDVDADGQFARGTQWSHVYSPRTRAYDFRMDVSPSGIVSEQESSVLAWHGLPGTGLGGMSTRSRSTSFVTPYTIAFQGPRSTVIEKAPIQVSSTKSLLGRWSGSVRLLERSDLQVRGDRLLRGDVVNPLPVELSDCMVVFENWAYRLDRTEGKLAPGQKTRIEGERPFNLEWRLMRRSVKDTADVTTAWDPAGRDVPRILEMVMFYRAANGATYTQLTHSYQRYVDLSDHLTNGCAILCGRSNQRATQLVIDGGSTPTQYDRHWTWYRILFPVRSSSPTDRSAESAPSSARAVLLANHLPHKVPAP